MAVILAGGAASRMGGADKPMLALGTGTILDEILFRVRPQVQAVAISIRQPSQHYAALGIPIVIDDANAGGTAAALAEPCPVRVAGRPAGPLAGIAAALRWAEAAGATSLLTIPGDTPFLPADLVVRLSPAPSVAAAGGRVHNLVCLLPVMIRPVLVAWLAQGHTRAGEFLNLIAARHVAFADPSAFLNINTPDDLDAARRLRDAAIL